MNTPNFELGALHISYKARANLSQAQLRKCLADHPPKCVADGLKAISLHKFKGGVCIAVTTELNTPRTTVHLCDERTNEL